MIRVVLLVINFWRGDSKYSNRGEHKTIKYNPSNTCSK